MQVEYILETLCLTSTIKEYAYMHTQWVKIRKITVITENVVTVREQNVDICDAYGRVCKN